MKIWHNNQLVDSLKLPAINSPWLLGDGVFETLRTYSGKVFGLELHLSRLVATCAALDFSGFDPQLIRQAVDATVLANPGSPDGRLRITLLSDGELIVTHQPYEPNLEAVSLGRYPGFRSSNELITGYKSISYANNLVGLRYASRNGFDDLLFVNERDEVMESGMANLLFYRDDQWQTPGVDSGCLVGITRGLLIENFGVQEATLLLKDVDKCDALALVSSLREIVVVKNYEGHFYPTFKPLLDLQTSFSEWIRVKLGE